MVGLVLVSHSAALAEGAAELAREMGGAEVRLEPAGGVESGDGTALGTDAVRVAEAIARADSGDGVLVLMDLGSAVLSAEMAMELVAPERSSSVVLSDAPLVEGAVAAAVAARIGLPLEAVAAEARGGLRAKAEHLGGTPEASVPPAAAAPPLQDGARELRLVVRNRLGLHARPAARLVQTAAAFDAEVTVTNVATGRGPASARSLNAVATLGVRHGHEILVATRGPQAAEALAAVAALAERGFDDEGGEEAAPAPLARPPAAARAGGVLAGLPGAPGLALGQARRLRSAEPQVPAREADDPAREWAALEDALARVRADVEATRASVAARAGPASAAIFDAHLLILADPVLLEPARRAVFEQRGNAAQAWSSAAEAVAAEYRALDDEYLRARAEDVEALRRAVVARLVGAGGATASLTEPGVLVAPELTPAETAALDPTVVRGIATAYGGPTSHSAILARSLGLPAVVGVGEELLAVAEGTALLVDGDAGTIDLEPSPELVADAEARMRSRAAAAAEARAVAGVPATTRDGVRIEVAANAGSPAEVDAALANGADGIGLLRTEFLFLGRESLPTEDEQADAYGTIAARLDGRPLILRTLDVGADKPLPSLPRPLEPNPFLGVRGIRLGLADPNLLETQLRAVLRVAAEHPLKVMFPMVATVAEAREALAHLAAARSRLEEAGVAPGEPEVGIMVEVPSAALVADALAPEVGFFSLGTNDLAQYTLAADRGNERVAALADPLHPAVLRLIALTTEAARRHGRWAGVCGEIASEPLAAPVLIGLGVTELSASPAAVPLVKEAVRAVDAAEAAAIAQQALALESGAAVRELLAESAGPVREAVA